MARVAAAAAPSGRTASNIKANFSMDCGENFYGASLGYLQLPNSLLELPLQKEGSVRVINIVIVSLLLARKRFVGRVLSMDLDNFRADLRAFVWYRATRSGVRICRFPLFWTPGEFKGRSVCLPLFQFHRGFEKLGCLFEGTVTEFQLRYFFHNIPEESALQ